MPERPPTLDPTREGLRRLGYFDSPLADGRRTVIVAGTNGKGSTCAALEAMLLAAGERTLLYTSPHLVDYTERFRIDGVDISREDFAAAHEAVLAGIGDLTLTQFEVLTLMAAWLAMRDPARRLLLEVGLGGTWDATNAIPHAICGIARLGLDHQNLLGPTIADIARNKFGIVTDRCTVAHLPLPDEARAVAREVQASTRTAWREARVWPWRVQWPNWFLDTDWGPLQNALAGPRGAENASLAMALLEACGADVARGVTGLSRARWPARMERRSLGGREVYLSGDHNPQGAQSLVELLQFMPRRHLHLLVGIGRDKDVEAMLECFATLHDVSIYLTETPVRGRSLGEYGRWAERASGAWSDPREALRAVLARAVADDAVVITGSLYLVGEFCSLQHI
jgi:dihydrofolate synthase/folylpolyglutamate synthase